MITVEIGTVLHRNLTICFDLANSVEDFLYNKWINTKEVKTESWKKHLQRQSVSVPLLSSEQHKLESINVTTAAVMFKQRVRNKIGLQFATYT